MGEGGYTRNLRQTIFAELGFEDMDTLVATTLKRGSGRDGSVVIDLALYGDRIVEINEPTISLIREAVDSSTAVTADESAGIVLHSLYQAITNSR